MDIGSFNRLVSYQRRVAGEDEHGQASGVWQTEFQRWTHILNPTGAEMIRAGGDASMVQCSLRVLNCPGTIDNTMRGVLQGTVYEIKAVLPDEVNQDFTGLVCVVVR